MPRTIDEVAGDIELTRVAAEEAVQETKDALLLNNPAAQGVRAAKNAATAVAGRVAEKARSVDSCVRSNIYRNLVIATGVGIAAGFILRGRSSRPEGRTP